MGKKTIKITFWIATALFAAFMIFSGITHLIGTESGKEVMLALGYPLYLNYILGIAKILGAIVLLIPQFKTLKEWAYAGFTFDIIGASASFAFTTASVLNAVFPLIFLIVLFASYISWKKLN